MFVLFIVVHGKKEYINTSFKVGRAFAFDSLFNEADASKVDVFALSSLSPSGMFG